MVNFRERQQRNEFSEPRKKRVAFRDENPTPTYESEKQILKIKLEKAYRGQINPKTKKRYRQREIMQMADPEDWFGNTGTACEKPGVLPSARLTVAPIRRS